MIAYLKFVDQLQAKLERFTIQQVPRDRNLRADLLANLGATTEENCTRNILITILCQSVLSEEPESKILSIEENDWRTPIRRYMQDYELPADKQLACKIKARAAHYTLVGLPGEPDLTLYRRSLDGSLLICVNGLEITYLLSELHQGSAKGHCGARSLALAAHRVGYY